MDAMKDLVSVEVLHSIYENHKRYKPGKDGKEGDKFLCTKKRASQLGRSVRILKEIHDPVIKEFIAPENRMLKESPIKKTGPVAEIKKEDVKRPAETEPVKDIPVKPLYVCSVCGKQFNSRLALMGHSRTHRRKRDKK